MGHYKVKYIDYKCNKSYDHNLTPLNVFLTAFAIVSARGTMLSSNSLA